MRGDLKITLYESGADVTPLIVTFSQCFISTDPPRTDIALGGDSSYAVSGNYLQAGTSFELPAFWTVDVLIPETDGNRLLAMWEIREAKRRSNVIFAAAGYRFELDDEAQEGTWRESTNLIDNYFSKPPHLEIADDYLLADGAAD